MFKDSVITARQKTRELIILLVCFVIAFFTNVGATIAYSGHWTEIFTQIGFVVVITGILYVLQWVVRIIAYLIKKIFS